MRETMYGWMALHLKGEGDGSPIPEPKFETEKPEDLRCYPGDTRPKDWVTIPQFAAAEGKKLLAAKGDITDADAVRKVLIEKTLGGFPDVKARKKPKGIDESGRFNLFPEPGLRSELDHQYDWNAPPDTRPLAVFLSLDPTSGRHAELVKAGSEAGWSTITIDLRATGSLANPSDKIGRAPDHNTAEWGLWIGRPLLGQWVFDVRQLLDVWPPVKQDIIVIGEGPAGLVALCAAATDRRVTKVAAVGTLASFVSDEPYVGQRLGVMAPGILRDVGDVAHLAALAAPKRVVIAGGVSGGGKPLTAEQLKEAYRPARASKNLVVEEKLDAAGVIRALEGKP
jgi:hypothetical protein